MTRVAWLLISITLIAASVFAKDGPPEVPLQAVWTTSAVPIGGSGELGVVFDVPPRHHITDVEYGLFYVEVTDTLGLDFGEPVFPAGVPYEGERAYRGRTIVRVPVTVAEEAVPGSYQWPITVGYQICQEFGEQVCFLPVDKSISLVVDIVPAGTPVFAAHEDVFGGEIAAADSEEPQSLEARVIAALEGGSWLAFLLVFVGGILTSFTPCVYPVIPITIGYIGGASAGKPLRGLGLSAIFVLGIAVIYSSLGLISAATGSLFGAFSGSPVVTIIVALIFGVMGFSMLGAFEIALPSGFQSKLQGAGPRGGILGALVMGMVSGLVMAPCVGPVIVALLAWVSKTGSLLYGWTLLFVFSLGLGLLFLVIGTFAGAIQALPKAGGWMENVKKGFGWILLAGALFLLRLTIPEPYYTLCWAVLLIAFAVFTGLFEPLTKESTAGQRLWKVVTVIVFLIGALQLVRVFGVGVEGRTAADSAVEVEWLINEEQAALAEAQREGKPVLIDFYADWCVACKELDHKTWTSPDVTRRVDDFVRLKFDFTRQTPWVSEIMEKYKITGMPTVILMNASGEEVARFTGFKSPGDFLSLLDRHKL